jgi:hypothetical protein
MSELESDFEDICHRLARKFSKRGLSVRAIGDVFASGAKLTKYVPEGAEYPQVFSALTAKRRALGHAK